MTREHSWASTYEIRQGEKVGDDASLFALKTSHSDCNRGVESSLQARRSRSFEIIIDSVIPRSPFLRPSSWPWKHIHCTYEVLAAALCP